MSEGTGIKSTRRIVGESLIALVVGIVLAFLAHQLFGEEFATRQQALVYAPVAGYSYGEGSRDQVRVLLIDDAALAAAGQGWPAQYSYSARLLRAVSQYRPKAVFIDIYYAATRTDESLPLLARQLCALKDQGTEVYLAATRNRVGEYTLRPELEQLAGRCFEKVAVSYTPDAIDRLAWNYPLLQPGGKDGAQLKSAALALYESQRGELAVDDAPLALTWGGRDAANGVGWVDSADAGKPYCRRSRGADDMWRSVVPDRLYDDAGQPVCVFHETIRAGQFTRTTPEDDARLRQLIEGKVVLIGTALSDSADLVLSPIHGKIPGVYLHAMALDNLLTYGPRYARDMPLSFDPRHASVLLFLLGSLIVVTLLPKALRAWLLARWKLPLLDDPLKYVASKTPRLGPVDLITPFLFVLLCVLRLLLSLAIGAFMLWVGQRVWHLGFLSIIGVIFLTMIAEWFEFNQKLTEYLVPPQAAPRPVHIHSSKESSDVVVSEPA